MTWWIKVVGAVLLLACFALPMSSCTRHVDKDGKGVASLADGSYPANTQTIKTHHYLLERVKSSEPLSWLNVAAFIWPTIFLLLARYRAPSRLVSVLWFTEPLLLAGSGFVIFVSTIVDDAEIGYYIGWAGVGIYVFGWVIEAVTKWRTWIKKGHISNSNNGGASNS